MNELDNCVFCYSNYVRPITYKGYCEFKGIKYDLLTEYTKCTDCEAEFISKSQIEKNKQYLDAINYK